jgi:tRNA pseudouridine55 synthase
VLTKNFDIAARDITIFDIDNVEIIGTEIALRIHCSKGTYIRSLARDVGAILGVGAYASAIRRVKSGGLDVKDAIAYDQLCADSIQQALCRGRRALSHLPLIELTSLQRDELRLGRNICETMALTSSMAIAIHDDEPIAILRNDGARTDLARVM